MASSGGGGYPVLDPDLLISEARKVALDTSAEWKVFLSPEALVGVDEMVRLRMPELSRLAAAGRFDWNRWVSHVQHIAEDTARELRRRGIARVVKSTELRDLAQPYAVFPYD